MTDDVSNDPPLQGSAAPPQEKNGGRDGIMRTSAVTVVPPPVEGSSGEAATTSTTTPQPGYSRQQTITNTTPKKKSGLFGTSSNMINSIVGAGIIGIPYAFRQSGLIAGILLLVLVGWLTDKSLRLIVDLASFHPKLKGRNVRTYEDLAWYPFGRLGSGFVLFNMFVLAYGAMVAYLLIIKDTVPTIFGVDPSGIERELVLIITSLLIVVPLSMQRDMASLAFTSLLSVTADVVLVGFVAAYSPVKETVSDAGGFGEVLKNNWISGTIFIGLGILSTAMACQHSAFIVSGSLIDRTRERWATVTCWSISIATILCGIMGITGYLGYLDETQGDILNNFEVDSLVANAARALLAITMFFTYPMESFVARHVLVKLLHNGDMEGGHEQANQQTNQANRQGEGGGEEDREAESVSFVQRFLLCGFLGRRIRSTLFIYIMALIPALIVDDLGPVLSITGSLGGSCVAYIAPGLVYLGVNGDEFLSWTSGMLERYRTKRGSGQKDNATGDIELPVAGDSNAVQQAPAPPSPSEGPKPCWYYILGFPLWCAVASTGSMGMKTKLDATEEVYQGMHSPVNGVEIEETTDADGEDVLHPKKFDYFASIFLIIFGVIAAVAGLISNIYVQVNHIFFTPT